MTSLVPQPPVCNLPPISMHQGSDRCGILRRTEYTTCHVTIPEQVRPVAAIAVADQFYSLFKAQQSLQDAQAIAQRLQEQGDPSLITLLPTGYAIWVWEPDAQVLVRCRPSLPPRPPLQERYHPCHIRVPHHGDRLAAIRVGDHYYSLFRIVNQAHHAQRASAKLSDRGHGVVITQTVRGYALWLLEPDAQPDTPTPETNLD